MFDGVEQAGFNSSANSILLAWTARSSFVFQCFRCLLCFYGLELWGWGSSDR